MILVLKKYMLIFALNFYSFILEFYENCGKVQCWKNEECCKMKCDENGLMIPDSQCLPTNPESSGCPLFICEPPQTTNKSIINETRQDDVKENPFFSIN